MIFVYLYIFSHAVMWTSIDTEISKDNLFGVLLPNGSWTGLRGQLQRGVRQFDAKIRIHNNLFIFFLMLTNIIKRRI